MKSLVSVGRETESGHAKASICEGEACREEGALQTDTGRDEGWREALASERGEMAQDSLLCL